MARVRPDQPLIPSVLDRLLDERPDVSREPAQPRRQLLRDLRNSVRRDLENLLNTRRRHGELRGALEGLIPSLVHYGLPDFKGQNVASEQERERLRIEIERTIRLYEPRFKTVHVELLDNAEPEDRMLRFRVDALLYAEPAPEPVVFDSALEPVTGHIQVQGGDA